LCRPSNPPPALSPVSALTALRQSQREEARRARRQSDRGSGAPAPAPAPTPAPAPAPRPRPDSATSSTRTPRVTLEVPGETVARQCLIAKQSRASPKILDIVRSAGPTAPTIPVIDQPGHPFHGKQLCFSYITDGDRGCHRRGNCRFAHLCLQCNDTRSLNPPIFRSMQRLVMHPNVTAHYRSTPPFVAFCTSLPPTG
jgi:hypothetical protein